jgi:hypothetical protein
MAFWKLGFHHQVREEEKGSCSTGFFRKNLFCPFLGSGNMICCHHILHTAWEILILTENSFFSITCDKHNNEIQTASGRT